ncbi:MAG: acyltransferase domain-containing protein, partial [Myxococcales bacterium]|nr:acyltransferase domain-containing protein [Myxococcales bacterium]
MSWDTPIAVVGMACRFPGADDAARYWQNVLHDVYAVRPLPPERFHRDRYYHPELGAYGKSYCDIGGLVSERPFDAPSFRMAPKSVASTDVAHLWALEVARAALEDAGYDPFALSKRNVGVVVGHARGSMMTADMAFGTAIEGLVDALGDGPLLAALGADGLADVKAEVIRRVHDRYPHRTEDGAVGSMTSALAGLISNAFGLTGRHMVVDAACASSFAALEIGARALQQGKLDAALVGGASYSQELSVIMFAQSRALSPDGTFPFDRRANGFISSDGFGLFLLRRLEDALRDGNRIRAVIRGVGGSCDGKGRALWAPRKEGQVLAMRRAYAESGVDPATVDLIEGHATSTPLGDRTEVEALHEVFAEARGGRPINVGSVKGNIGHAREAAGAAGLAKAIMALEQATLPPTGNFREPSEEIPWSEVAVEVVTAPRPWSASGVRRAGCNAFGIGGLNYHVIVEEAPPERRVFTGGAPRLEATQAPLARADIAVVGLGARLPESPSAEALYENLVTGRDLTTRVPRERWDADLYFQAGDRARYRTYLDKGAFVRGFEANWQRYKMPPKLIERNDPLQFMLLESAMDALEGAGLDPAQLDREKVAVIMGTVFGSDFALELSLAIRAQEVAETVAEAMGRPGDEAILQDVLQSVRGRLPSINEDSSGSFSSSTLASRIAKTLDLMGPAYAIDAACASSMASVEAACELLRDGVVDLAIAGGGDRAMRVQRFEAYCQFYALTRSGQPRPFDARADGFLPGEGAGVVVLERLEDAQRNGREILGVIRGMGASGDGERKSLYKPSADGLSRAMSRAFAQAPEVSPQQVGYVECHGGATPLGDATEVAAVRAVYGPRKEPLTLGSVKSNIGHTQGAAGVAALIKATQILSQGTLPPTRGFEAPHPDHHFGAELRVSTQPEPYRHDAVGVSSMGLAGINYHVVLAQAPGDEAMTIDSEIQLPSAVPAADRPAVIRVSARDLGALGATVAGLDPSTAFASRQVGEGPAVLTLAAESADDVARAQALVAKAGLGETTRELREKQGVFTRAHAAGSDRVAFLFSGQGSQYPGMMVAFAEASPGAQDILRRVDAWLEAHALPTLGPRLLSGEALPRSVFGVQCAVLTADLMAHAALVESGVRADVLTGHSFGDYAALVAAGVWSLEDALTATRLRANAIEGAEVSGGMTSVTAGKAQVQEALQRSGSRAELANVNAPDQVVVAGAVLELERLEAHLTASGVAFSRLEVPGPFHSSLMGRARGLLQAALTRIALSAPQTPYLSSITGRFESDPEAIRAALVAQLEAPVDFVAQVQRLSA